MAPLRYTWNAAGTDHVFDLIYVAGTHGRPYPFGEPANGRAVEVQNFYIGTTPVTQALWTHVMGADANPAKHRGMELPREHVSWEQITRANGFLDRINESPVH